MKVDVQRRGSVVVLTPRDAINEVTLAALRGVVEEHRGATSRLVLDLTQVPFLDSAGIEFLLELAGDPSGGPLRPRLAGLNETLRETLDLTETLGRFFVFDGVESAVRSYV